MDKDELRSLMEANDTEIERLEKAILTLTAQLHERDAMIEQLRARVAELEG